MQKDATAKNQIASKSIVNVSKPISNVEQIVSVRIVRTKVKMEVTEMTIIPTLFLT